MAAKSTHTPMRASRSRTREHTNLLTATPDEAALAIACFLITARDLLSLRLTCRRFDIKCIASGGGGPGRARRPRGERGDTPLPHGLLHPCLTPLPSPCLCAVFSARW